MRKNIACINKDAPYAIQTVYFWDEHNTWEEVQNGDCQVIEVTLHSGYRPNGKIMTLGEKMYMPLGDYLGEYDSPAAPLQDAKLYDWACRIVTRENQTYTTQIEVNAMGNPVVTHTKKEA